MNTTVETNVPALRFPEFSVEWEVSPIGEYTESISGVALKGEEITDDSSGQIILRGINITEGYIRHNSEIDRYYSGKTKLPEKFYVKQGDMVIGMDGSKVGRNVAIVGKADTDSILIQRVARVRHKLNADIYFIYHKVFSPEFHKYVDTINTSSAIPHISLQQIKYFTIGFPPLPEQQKIASFLTAVDTKIEQLTKKKALLEQYKKGIMQQLFSQQLRFKDDNGEEFPEWKEKYGNDIFKNVSDRNHNSDLPILAITQEYGAIPRDMIEYEVSVTEKSIETYKVVQAGDFIISLRSFQGGIEYSNYKGICSPAYIVLRPTVPIDNYFFKLYFKTETYIKKLQRNLEGIRDGKMISYKYFSEIELPFPSLPEQQKIASFLSTIDARISLIDQQTQGVKAYKKGLLQQLFV